VNVIAAIAIVAGLTVVTNRPTGIRSKTSYHLLCGGSFVRTRSGLPSPVPRLPQEHRQRYGSGELYGVTWLDMTRAAVAELGTGASPELVVAFTRHRYGKDMDPRFVPVYLATIRGEEMLRQARENAAAVPGEEADRPAKKRRAS
jgi:hypothetical protein